MASAQYLVAMCDVLGFSDLVATRALDQIHERYLELVKKLEPSPLFRIVPKTYEREIVLNRVVFSDTVLYWAPAGDTMELLPHVLGQVMAESLGSLPLRAGLAFGECVIDPAKQIYIGQPIIDAYHTEQAQEWMGGAFHPSCWRPDGFLEVLCKEYERCAVRYPVPIVTSRQVRVPQLDYALNWPALAGPGFSVELLAAQEDRAPERDRVKWQNARRLYETYLAQRKA